MELKLKRKYFTEESTVGELFVNDVFFCYILEDKDRGLTQTMSLTEINEKKINAVTCIPYGRYEIQLTFSNRFQRVLPLLVGVPGYEGVRIHSGNVAKDTEGCLLPGKTRGINVVNDSRNAFAELFVKLSALPIGEKIHITIEKA